MTVVANPTGQMIALPACGWAVAGQAPVQPTQQPTQQPTERCGRAAAEGRGTKKRGEMQALKALSPCLT